MACASLQGGAISSIIMGAGVQYLVIIIIIIKYLGATSGILFLILLLITGYLVMNIIIKYLGATC